MVTIDMHMFVWLACALVLLGGSLYFQKRCAEIEGELAGEDTLWAFLGTTWLRGSTAESRELRRLLCLMMATGLLAIVHLFRLAASFSP